MSLSDDACDGERLRAVPGRDDRAESAGGTAGGDHEKIVGDRKRGVDASSSLRDAIAALPTVRHSARRTRAEANR